MLQESFFQAAGRHLISADTLHKAAMWDESVYLAGYVVECTYKAVAERYVSQMGARAYNHKISELENKGMKRLRVLFPETDKKLPLSRTEGTILDRYHPERRYAANGLWTETESTTAVDRARSIFYETVGGLVLDGIVPRRELG